MGTLNLEGMAIADGVVDTIVAIALQDIEGVVYNGVSGPAGLLGSIVQQPSTQGIEVKANEDNTLAVSVHIDALYGYVLPDLAAQVRASVAHAVFTQVGVEVSSVDVYIDNVQFVA